MQDKTGRDLVALLNQLGISSAELDAALAGPKEGFDELRRSVLDQARANGENQLSQTRLRVALDALSRGHADAVVQFRERTTLQGESTDATRDATAAFAAGSGVARGFASALASIGNAARNTVGGLQAATTAALNLFSSASTAQSSASGFASALDDLAGKGGKAGGGSKAAGDAAETAAEKMFKAGDMSRNLRDAHLGIADAARQSADAHDRLQDAQAAAVTATADLEKAQLNLQRVLSGEGPDSTDAVKADDDLAAAKRDLRSAELDVLDAEENLAKVRDDQTATPKQIERAELALGNARARVKVQTDRAAEALRVYSGIVDGFPAEAEEARRAQDEVTKAQSAAEVAARGVADAQLTLEAAQRRAEDAGWSLARAQAESAGQLDRVARAAGGGGAGGVVKSYEDRLWAAATAAVKFAEDQTELAVKLGLTNDPAQTFLDILQDIIDKNPALKPILDEMFGHLRQDLEAIDKLKFDAVNRLTKSTGKSMGELFSAAGGGLFKARPGGYLVNIAEAGGDEVVLPLDDPARSMQLLAKSGLLAPSSPAPVAAAQSAPLVGTLAALDIDEALRKLQTEDRRRSLLLGG